MPLKRRLRSPNNNLTCLELIKSVYSIFGESLVYYCDFPWIIQLVNLQIFNINLFINFRLFFEDVASLSLEVENFQ